VSDAVTLRALHAADADRVVEQCNDPESVAWTTVPHPYGRDDAMEWIGEFAPRGWADGSDLTLAVEHAGLFAGSVSLRPRGAHEAEVGFGLHPDARGRGVMRAALDLLLDWAFTERGVTVVHWRANVGNWASRRVAWACGFTFGPTIPGLLPHRGEWVDAWTGWLHRDDPRRPAEPWREVPVLETERLRLRPWAEADVPRLVEAARDPVLQRWVEAPLPRRVEDAAAYLVRVRLGVARGDRLAWCVADRRSDRALGNVALFEFEGPDGAGAAQVGYWAHPGARGSGVMTEAVDRVAAWAFADGGLRRLYLMTAASNAASRRLAERAGFTHLGTERLGAPLGDGSFDDNCVYDRLATD
jgi:RimJ/RimL family protein N-acetyltransferase